MNQRMTSSSVAPMSAAKYRTDPRSASAFRRSPSASAFSTCRPAKSPGIAGALGNDFGPALALLIVERHGGARAALGCGLFHGTVDLGEAAVEVRHDAGLHRDPAFDIGGSPGGCDVAGHGVLDVRLGQEAVGANGVQPHQDGDQGDE